MVDQDSSSCYAADLPRRVRPLVAASVGCYGACLPGGVEFTGVYDKGTEELIDWHRRRFFVLANVSCSHFCTCLIRRHRLC
jgi:homocysteine S-methyltransferase